MKKYLSLILISALILSACGKKNTTAEISPTPTPRLVELEVQDRPEISLIPRSDGHELTLRLASISSNITRIEYEITYIANDNGLEIEKGASGIFESSDIAPGKSDKKILLGTESCTSGCKYKYDEGITGGNVSLIFTTANNQISTFTTPFILRSAADVKKAGKLIWTEEDFTYTPPKFTGINFFIALKDYKNASYLVTSNASL